MDFDYVEFLNRQGYVEIRMTKEEFDNLVEALRDLYGVDKR